ncbi:MAG: SDR family oxidoreductase [Deinococcota bacterium]
MTSLQGQVAVVTGASSGIGEATAKALAQAGASVTLAARRVDKLEALEQTITQAGGKALSIETDVTSRKSVTAMITATEDAFGPVDILVNNAGIMLLSFLEACKVDEWDSMVDVNIKGVLYGTGAVLPSMIERGRGHIINVSSIAGRKVMPSAAVYAATKYAVRAFSDGLRQELSGKYGIRVTCIEPGLVGTELLEHISDPNITDRMQQVVGNMTVLSSEDIADTIMYAVSAPPHVNVHELLILPTDQ